MNAPSLFTDAEIRAWLRYIGSTDTTNLVTLWRARRPPRVVDLDGKPVRLHEHSDGSWRTTRAGAGRLDKGR